MAQVTQVQTVILRLCRLCLFFNAKENVLSVLEEDLCTQKKLLSQKRRELRHLEMQHFFGGQTSLSLKHWSQS